MRERGGKNEEGPVQGSVAAGSRIDANGQASRLASHRRSLPGDSGMEPKQMDKAILPRLTAHHYPQCERRRRSASMRAASKFRSSDITFVVRRTNV